MPDVDKKRVNFEQSNISWQTDVSISKLGQVRNLLLFIRYRRPRHVIQSFCVRKKRLILDSIHCH